MRWVQRRWVWVGREVSEKSGGELGEVVMEGGD